MKIEQVHPRGNNSLCEAAFHLLRVRTPAQLRGNIGHGTCNYICMYINSVSNNVVLQLHDFYNIFFKSIKL
jgi:hypothetical protein